MKCPAPVGDPLAEVLDGHDELHERGIRARGADRVAVGAAQGRARHDPAVVSRREGLPDQPQPRPAVVVDERHSRAHLLHVRRRMQVVGVDERDAGERMARRSASAAPTSDLPAPLGPITTRRGGAATAVMRCRLADARRRAAASARPIARSRRSLSNSAQR